MKGGQTRHGRSLAAHCGTGGDHHADGVQLVASRHLAALRLLERLPLPEAQDALQQLKAHKTRIIFKPLWELSPKYAQFDALSWISPDDTPYIFINITHQGAPVEALAALIAHEALHTDTLNSIEEEVAGWTREGRIWAAIQVARGATESAAQAQELSQLTLRAPQFPSRQVRKLARQLPPTNDAALVTRLNTIVSHLQAGSLAETVASNPGYAGLPKTQQDAYAQPGFEEPVEQFIPRRQSRQQGPQDNTQRIQDALKIDAPTAFVVAPEN
jgi:hypothetical protein